MTQIPSKPLEKLREESLKKIKQLRQLGVNPYPSTWEELEKRTKNAELKDRKLEEVVVIAGRIISVREHGKLIFMDLKDDSGTVQVSYRQENFAEKEWKIITLLDRGDFVGIRGKLYRTKTGELTLETLSFKLLAKAIRPLPLKLTDTETRYRQRYVDLIVNPKVREVFETRTKIVSRLRKFLDEHGFVEVETPILQPLYGGTSAKPFVTHHETLDKDLYLRISDELYLKRLIVGGFEKVYEIGKDFRNEGISSQHNPEFTQMEFYWAYADYEKLIEFTQQMITHIMQETLGTTVIGYQGDKLDFTPPWKKVTFRELLLNTTGIDIDAVDTEEKLLRVIKDAGIKLNLEGKVGYGPLVDELYKTTARPTLTQPTLLLDYPVEMIALAKRKEDQPRRIASFQLLVRGFEIIKAYNELNDPVDQRKRWEEEEELGRRGFAEHMKLDEDYLRALEYGMPPTGGLGLGIDRLTMILTNQPSIKDVILFPTLKPE